MISIATTSDSNLIMKYKRDIYFYYQIYSLMPIPTKKCVFYLSLLLANEDHDKEHPLTKSKPFSHCGFRLNDRYPLNVLL